MARPAVANHSLAGSRSARSSRHRSSVKRRHRIADAEVEPVRPNTVELRRLRDAYFSQPERARARAARVESSSKKDKSAQDVRKTKKKSEHSAEERSKRSVGKRPDRTAEYVYGTAAPVEVIIEEYGEEFPEPAKARKSRRRSADPQTGSLPDVEIAPSDSVSQMGSRRHRRSMRTSLRTEKPKESIASKTKRTSFLGSLFNRRTSAVSTTPETVGCLTCGSDDVPSSKAAKLECGHRMCHSCLKRIFRLAVQDPAHMPPKCCTEQHIPLKYVDRLFDFKFKLLFNKKFDEYRTKNRVYCPNRKCGVWIRPAYYHNSNGRRFAQCNRCNTRACVLCGMKLHKTRDCPKDPEIAKLVKQAEQQGWKRCYSCNAMVELREGCNHMTCRCTAQFCMVCGAKWKTCDCAWFNPTALPPIHRANGAAPQDPFAFVQQLFADIAPPQAQGYRHELNERRRQVREDEDLARRMAFANLFDGGS